jgi:hypothetical protein
MMKDYAVIFGGYIVNVIRWDGITPYDPPEGSVVMLLATALADGYEYAPAPPAVRRVWESAGDFWAEFTQTEQMSISVSLIPDIAALRSFVYMWRGEVWSDSPRVQGGISALIAANLLTTERAQKILSPPGYPA